MEIIIIFIFWFFLLMLGGIFIILLVIEFRKWKKLKEEKIELLEKINKNLDKTISNVTLANKILDNLR